MILGYMSREIMSIHRERIWLLYITLVKHVLQYSIFLHTVKLMHTKPMSFFFERQKEEKGDF